jgi:hypothetical protein
MAAADAACNGWRRHALALLLLLVLEAGLGKKRVGKIN